MGFKSVTILVTDSQADAAALAAAAEVAQREDAHLDVHCIGIDPARYDATPMGAGAAVIDYSLAEAQADAEALLDWVKATLPRGMEKVSVQSSVVPHMGLDAMVARLARYADLVVAARPYAAAPAPAQVAVLEAVLFGALAPVLVVPDSPAPYAQGFERVMVAWDESDEALGTIRSALPVLQAASRVDVVMVDPPSHSPERSDPGGALSLMLARHGVRAEVSILARTMPRTSDVLLRFAGEHGVELIVMGAYGHSRLREAVLGGATRETLERSRLPLFMAH